VGPPRLTGSGRAAPGAVLAVALASFGVAAVAGLGVVLLTGLWWMLAVGALSIAAAWGYTGGRRPYGYRALGEVAVLVFFGLVPVLGTQLAQIGRVTADGVAGALALGLFACAVLMVNNIRDIDVDRAAGKRTLAVVVGRRTARILYALLMLLPYAVLVVPVPHAPLALVALASLVPAIGAVRRGTTAEAPLPLIRALQLSSMTSLLFGILLAVALVVDATA
jgi:1,4-dihydroxy-2-naphthoate octaprenyltransferase